MLSTPRKLHATWGALAGQAGTRQAGRVGLRGTDPTVAGFPSSTSFVLTGGFQNCILKCNLEITLHLNLCGAPFQCCVYCCMCFLMGQDFRVMKNAVLWGWQIQFLAISIFDLNFRVLIRLNCKCVESWNWQTLKSWPELPTPAILYLW